MISKDGLIIAFLITAISIAGCTSKLDVETSEKAAGTPVETVMVVEPPPAVIEPNVGAKEPAEKKIVPEPEIPPAPLKFSTTQTVSNSVFHRTKLVTDGDLEESRTFVCKDCPYGMRIDPVEGIISWMAQADTVRPAILKYEIEVKQGNRSGVYSGTISIASVNSIVVDTLVVENPPLTNGNCTVVEAIEAANSDTAVDNCSAGSNSAMDYIYLPEGYLNFVDDYAGSGNALPTITGDTTLIGHGPSETVIRRANDAMDDVRGSTAPDFRLFTHTNPGIKMGIVGVEFQGGSIGAFSSTEDMNIYESKFHNNTRLTHNGGAGWVSGNNFVAYDTEFSENRANCWAGALVIVGGTQATFINSKFRNNDSSAGNCGMGSAILAETAGVHVEMEDSLFEGNSGGWAGGPLTIQHSATGNIIRTEFRTAARSGATFLNHGPVFLKSCKFKDNGWRSIFKSGSGELVIEDTVLDRTGTAFYADSATAGKTIFDNVIFKRNGSKPIVAIGNQNIEILSVTFENAATNAIDLNNDDHTLNDDGDSDVGPSGLLNFPVITSSVVSGDTLTIRGFAPPAASIQFYSATADDAGFGGALMKLFQFSEGSGADKDITSGSYGPDVNGVTVGSETTTKFKFIINIKDLSKNVASKVAKNSYLVAVATKGGVSSEFSNQSSID